MRKGFGSDGLGGPITIDKDQAGGSEGQLGNELQDSTRFRHWGRGVEGGAGTPSSFFPSAPSQSEENKPVFLMTTLV